MWSSRLPGWYTDRGRHELPWRRTGEPWAVLVSEVMLQQTAVARVLPRWEAFLTRWPTPQACAAASLAEVLREWDGLGYPRRARGLWLTAGIVAATGWPTDEAGLSALPGVGAYTARALLVLATGAPSRLPRDVNLSRVAARAALGCEPHQARPRALDGVLATARPPSMPVRDWVLALMDLGATVCTARSPRCSECPLLGCASRRRLEIAPPPPPRRRQPAYAGSLRQLRGALLRALLGPDPPATPEALRRRVRALPAAAAEGAVEQALAGLRTDGLVPDDRPYYHQGPWPPPRRGSPPRGSSSGRATASVSSPIAASTTRRAP